MIQFFFHKPWWQDKERIETRKISKFLEKYFKNTKKTNYMVIFISVRTFSISIIQWVPFKPKKIPHIKPFQVPQTFSDHEKFLIIIIFKFSLLILVYFWQSLGHMNIIIANYIRKKSHQILNNHYSKSHLTFVLSMDSLTNQKNASIK